MGVIWLIFELYTLEATIKGFWTGHVLQKWQ